MTIEETIKNISEHLESLPILNGIAVVPEDEEQDMDQMLTSYLSKSKGYSVLIGETDNRSLDDDAPGPRTQFDFGVTIYVPKIGRESMPKGSEIRTAIIRSLHHSASNTGTSIYEEIYYKSGRIFEEKRNQNNQFRIYAMTFKTTAQY